MLDIILDMAIFLYWCIINCGAIHNIRLINIRLLMLYFLLFSNLINDFTHVRRPTSTISPQVSLHLGYIDDHFLIKSLQFSSSCHPCQGCLNG